MLNRNFLVGCGVGGGEAHLYWRIRITSSVQSDAGGATICGVREMEFRASHGGADQANGGSASADSTQYGSASEAFNNDTGFNGWTSVASPFPHWLKYQFPAPVAVSEVSITVGTHFLGNPLLGPTTFWLEWSDDDVLWTPVKQFTATWPGGDPQTQLFQV